MSTSQFGRVLLFVLAFGLNWPVQAQTRQVEQTLASLNVAWPCHYADGNTGKWHDCPTKVEAGLYVLGPEKPTPSLDTHVEFTLDEPALFYVGGTARCEGCHQLLLRGGLALLGWDGSAWQYVHLGGADFIERCIGWTETCTVSGAEPGPWTLGHGKYRLWAHTASLPMGSIRRRKSPWRSARSGW